MSGILKNGGLSKCVQYGIPGASQINRIHKAYDNRRIADLIAIPSKEKIANAMANKSGARDNMAWRATGQGIRMNQVNENGNN